MFVPWAPAEIFPEGGKITDTLKSRHVFGAPYRKLTVYQRAEGANEKFCVFSRRFRLKYRASGASAVGASENFRVFCRTAAYDVIFQIPGGGKCPPLPPPAGAHGSSGSFSHVRPRITSWISHVCTVSDDCRTNSICIQMLRA